ncbi:protein of unknown function [endosymbiont DhMRE of Dentiscutata heterogama]|uniref:hypothetical protein n=1 Tax=endosymbiont DhMRE of Dentiscutata heterogama TaxID=1609546 RepID=UPI000629D4D4|nr:hypothetical protein [endosymbiont DhMRE of Dentiscutata heterogama]CFW93410.1 protein of unknown function [endosymbiont DhMRE of Dentiscutata heterogama]
MIDLKRFKKDEDFEELVKLYACRGVPREQLERIRERLLEKNKIEKSLNEARREKNEREKARSEFFYQIPRALEEVKKVEKDEKKLKILKEIEENYWEIRKVIKEWETEGYEPMEEEINRAKQIVLNDK